MSACRGGGGEGRRVVEATPAAAEVEAQAGKDEVEEPPSLPLESPPSPSPSPRWVICRLLRRSSSVSFFSRRLCRWIASSFSRTIRRSVCTCELASRYTAYGYGAPQGTHRHEMRWTKKEWRQLEVTLLCDSKYSLY